MSLSFELPEFGARRDAIMTDKTGHMDRPGAGPSTVNLVNPVTRMPSNLYHHLNPATEKHEIVKGNCPGVADEVLAEFDTHEGAKRWFLNFCQRNV
jgi:hypothetical protein